MNLTQKFDCLAGFDPDRKGPSIAESFVPKANENLAPGHVVTLNTSGTVEKFSTGGDTVAPWMVVRAGDFDNTFSDKVVCVRGNVLVETDKFVVGNPALAYAVGTLLTVSSGLLTEAAQGDQIVGEVVENKKTANGTLVVYFHGGLTRKP